MRYSGIIGFGLSLETEPGIWEDSIVEKPYFGDVIRNSRRWDAGEGVNDELQITNQISVVADSFCQDNAFLMKYIEWRGTKWKIASVDIQYPRIVITMGGVYNGPGPKIVEDEPEGTPSDS